MDNIVYHARNTLSAFYEAGAAVSSLNSLNNIGIMAAAQVTNNSTSNDSSSYVNMGGLNISNFNNYSNKDTQILMQEMSFYLNRAANAKG